MATMTVKKAMDRIRSAGHDISGEYSEERCIEFINSSIQQVASMLIGAGWPSLIKEVVARNGDSLPANFMKAVGTYPIRMTDGHVEIIDDDYQSVRFRYFATPKLVEGETDVLPFDHDGINDVVVKGAIILALNENEYDISQDSALLTALQQAIASGMN